MTPRLTEEEERRRERERIKKILSLAPPELREEALRLALTTDMTPEECAVKLLAKARTRHNGNHEQPSNSSVWVRALQEATQRRLARQ